MPFHFANVLLFAFVAIGFVFAEIFIFVAILAVGLAYVWAMGDLEWVKGLRQDVLESAKDKGLTPPPPRADVPAKKAA